MSNIIQHKRNATWGNIPAPEQLADGELAINTFEGKLFLKRSASDNKVVEVGSLAPRFVTLLYPTGVDVVPLFYTPTYFPVGYLKAVLVGTGTPSVTFTIKYGTSLASGTEMVVGGVTCTNTTTGITLYSTSFDNDTVPAGNWVWLETTAIAGSVTALQATLVAG